MEITHSLDPVLNSKSQSVTIESTCIYQEFLYISSHHTALVSRTLYFADTVFVRLCSKNMVLYLQTPYSFILQLLYDSKSVFITVILILECVCA